MGSPIEDLSAQLRQKYPEAKIVVHAPVRAGRVWWMDFALGPTKAEVEWSPSSGFGVSVNSEAVFGAQSDEVFSSTKAAATRLIELIQSGKQTEDSSEQFIRALREGRKLTQTQLAKLLKVKQASVSRLESRADFHISTLRSIITRLGGTLELRASFPDGIVHILKYSERASSGSSKLSHGKHGGKRSFVRERDAATRRDDASSVVRSRTARKERRRIRPSER